MRYIKSAAASQTTESQEKSIRDRVEIMLLDIERRKEKAVIEYARTLDGWDGEFLLSKEKRASLIQQVPESLRQDIQFAHRQVTRFAVAQRDSLTEFEIETEAGVRLGQRVIPMATAGCYVPGGRYAHMASAVMSVATAKTAGVENIIACSPPRGTSMNAATAYAMDLSGADVILEMGGVQAIATMAYGLFGCPEADIIVGPGNAYVAEAKRILFGTVGIDVFAGPTESAIIADQTADPMTVVIDLVSQAEHGMNSPVWLFTTDESLANAVDRLLPQVAADMPNADVVNAAWRDYGVIVLCDSPEEVVTISDEYAPEHLQIIASDSSWWLKNLRNYGSLFIGEGSTVSYGDKCAGTNHILPTRRASRYSGGLNVQKFLKTQTYQEILPEANKTFGAVASRISRAEGMEGHARACDWRLRKYYPDTQWDFEVYEQKRYS
ncbi:histidinol dehydrogenase [uncultured Castellaniella sp.]|uniref:histidinol dehydrogenase n=1 Tax=uncultured Castellaniella sp. TaxID=647907 RepID=UPI00262C7DEC|nr:histidinol dehydrogenase [uncultured Castellaniella sp.]